MSDQREASTTSPQIAYLLCGLPGSGKTSYAEGLLTENDLVKFSIDEAMYARHGVCEVDYPRSQYRELEAKVYEELDVELQSVLEAGISVVLDYGLWRRAQRDKYKQMLGRVGVGWRLIYFRADREMLKRRLEERNKTAGPNSFHIDEEMFEWMHTKFEEPADEGEEIVEVG